MLPVLLLLLALTCLPARPARAHPQFGGTTVNRYSKLALLPRGQLRLIYTLMVGDVPAFALRRGADRNGDGRVDQAEGAALAADLRDRAARGLSLTLDGAPVQLRFEEPTLGLAGDAVAPSAFSVDLVAVAAAPPGKVHELRFEDKNALPPVGEVEVILEEGPGVKLLLANQGPPRPERPERTTLFRFYGPPASSLADRSITARFAEALPAAAPPPGPGRGPRPLVAIVVLCGVLLAGAGLLIYRRMKG